jgi:cytochrome c
MRKRKLLGAATAMLLTAGAGFAIGAPAAGSPPAAPPRPAAFLQCAACHSVDPGKNGVGPSLAGVAGRKAASLPGFNYSPALRNSGLTWNAASLDTWLTSPQRAVPGTRMPFAGLSDPVKRKAVVDYLMTLK